MATDDWLSKFFTLFGEPENRDGQYFHVLDMLKQQQVPHQAYNFDIQRQAGGDGRARDDDSKFCALHEQHKQYQAKACANAANAHLVSDQTLLSGINEIMNAKRQRYERKRHQSAVQMKISNLLLEESIAANDENAANLLKMKIHKEQTSLAAAESELKQQLEDNEQLIENYKKIANQAY